MRGLSANADDRRRSPLISIIRNHRSVLVKLSGRPPICCSMTRVLLPRPLPSPGARTTSTRSMCSVSSLSGKPKFSNCFARDSAGYGMSSVSPPINRAAHILIYTSLLDASIGFLLLMIAVGRSETLCTGPDGRAADSHEAVQV